MPAAPPPPPKRGPLGRVAGLPVDLWRTFSGLGLVIGALFFAAALTPSLIPRSAAAAGGAVGGVLRHRLRARGAAARGVGVDAAAAREPEGAAERTWAAAALAAVVVVRFLWKSAEWQDSIRERMGMPLVAGADR